MPGMSRGGAAATLWTCRQFPSSYKVSTLLALSLATVCQAGSVTWRCCSHLGLTCRRSPPSFRVNRSTSPMPSSSSCSNDQFVRWATCC